MLYLWQEKMGKPKMQLQKYDSSDLYVVAVERQYDFPAIMFGENELNILPLFLRHGVPTNLIS